MIDPRNPVHDEVVRKLAVANDPASPSAGDLKILLFNKEQISYVLHALQGGCPHGETHN